MLLTTYGLFFRTGFEKGFILSRWRSSQPAISQKLECANYWAWLTSVRLLSLRVLARLNVCHYLRRGSVFLMSFQLGFVICPHFLLLLTRGSYLQLFSDKACGLDPRCRNSNPKEISTTLLKHTSYPEISSFNLFSIKVPLKHCLLI